MRKPRVGKNHHAGFGRKVNHFAGRSCHVYILLWQVNLNLTCTGVVEHYVRATFGCFKEVKTHNL